jgi:uncharacterized protein
LTRAWVLPLVLWTSLVCAQAPVPALTARVNDHTNTLSAEQRASLEQLLQGFEARKGAQIAVLMVATTGGEPVEQYALRVAEQWKIGRKKVDDGALLVVAKDDRALRIEVGYGLEGALNDATAKRIVADTIVPRFRQGDFYGGLSAGLDRMIRVIDGEPLPAPRGAPGGPVRESLPMLLMVALFAALAMRALLGRFLGSLVAGGAVGWLAFAFSGVLLMAIGAGVIAFLFSLFSGGGRRLPMGYGGYGGFGMPRSGGWSGGGGFRGGGGSFGGGGASGRW